MFASLLSVLASLIMVILHVQCLHDTQIQPPDVLPASNSHSYESSEMKGVSHPRNHEKKIHADTPDARFAEGRTFAPSFSPTGQARLLAGCTNNCLTCEAANPSTCLTCDETQFEYLAALAQCEPYCNLNQYRDGVSCLSCHPTCRTCLGPNALWTLRSSMMAADFTITARSSRRSR